MASIIDGQSLRESAGMCGRCRRACCVEMTNGLIAEPPIIHARRECAFQWGERSSLFGDSVDYEGVSQAMGCLDLVGHILLRGSVQVYYCGR